MKTVRCTGYIKNSNLQADAVQMNSTDNESQNIYYLYTQYQGLLLSVGLRFRLPREELMDIIDQLFLDLIEKRPAWENITNHKAYILTAFKRRLIDHGRTNKKLQQLYHSVPAEETYEPSAEEKITERQVTAETVLKIQSAFRKLPDRCQKVIFMKFYEGLSNEEIAEKTGLAIRSVYNNLFEGIRQLRKEMKETPGNRSMPFFSLLFLTL
jgi:RNA polymerase sigma-70 factor (ECF subfamily)